MVTTETGGETVRQVRVVDARSSWRSASSLTSHFGLGGAARIERIEVIWPSGATDRIPGPLGVNRRVRIVEGAGIEGGAGTQG